jgi:TolA-binding protein
MTDPVKSDIDALARRLPRRGPAPERSAAMRRAVLEGASHARPRSSRVRFGAVLAAAAAAAAVWAVIALRSSPSTRPDAGRTAIRTPEHTASPALGSTASSGSASGSGAALAAPTASGASAGPARDRLAEGTTTFEAAHPLQLAQGSATLTAPAGARFDVEVRDARVVRVAVKAGWVVLASAGSASASTTMIAAETTWLAPVRPAPVPMTPAEAASLASPATVAGGAARGPAPLPSPPAANEPRLPAYERMPPGPASSPPAAAAVPPPAQPPDGARVAEGDPQPALPPAPPPPPSAESEQAFHHGLRALLSGDALKAAKELDRACAPPSTIQQDACYWAAVAWRRAGDRARARSGFAEILSRWPRSPHVGEASVGLGWLLLEAGERAEARLRFAAGVSDPTSSVREEALRGLSAAR